MNIFHGAVLGLIQGLTEFFPVSSSGHLIVLPALFGWPDQGLAFDTVLHLGTLCALLWAFRRDLRDVFIRGMLRSEGPSRNFILRVGAAAIPGLLIGGLFGDMIASALRGPIPVAIDTAFWALVLWGADRSTSGRRDALTDARHVTWRQALAVGISQVLALMPGTSRSGITMTAGLLSGMDRSAAVTFSFYLSIPTIAAAGGYGLIRLFRTGLPAGEGAPLLVGFIMAFLSGAWAIRFLRSYVAKHPFHVFIWYRFALAIAIVALVR